METEDTGPQGVAVITVKGSQALAIGKFIAHMLKNQADMTVAILDDPAPNTQNWIIRPDMTTVAIKIDRMRVGEK